MAKKIKKNDEVIVLTGKSKGQRGTVIQSITATNKVLVSGVNVATRHNKPSQVNPQGGITKQEMPIHVSNVALIDPKEDKATRVGFKTLDDGKKVRVAKRSGEVLNG